LRILNAVGRAVDLTRAEVKQSALGSKTFQFPIQCSFMVAGQAISVRRIVNSPLADHVTSGQYDP